MGRTFKEQRIPKAALGNNAFLPHESVLGFKCLYGSSD